MADLTLERVGIQQVKRNRVWYIVLGVILVVLGIIAIGSTYAMAKASMIFLGWLLIIGGITQVFHAFWKERGWSGIFIDLLVGILSVVVGLAVVANPKMTALTLALMIAFYLVFEGVFRICAAIAVRYPNRTWMLLSGTASLVLGLIIWNGWPDSGLRFVGLFIGIHIILNGWTTLMLGLAAKYIPDDDEIGGEAGAEAKT